MQEGSFKIPVEVVQVAVIIAPGSEIKCIKNASFVQGKDGVGRLEIEYVTKLGYEGEYWFDANDFMRDAEEAKPRGGELKYIFNLYTELV